MMTNRSLLQIPAWGSFLMRIFLSAAIIAWALIVPGRHLSAAPTVERNWMLLRFHYSGERPRGAIKLAGLTQIANEPRIFSGLVRDFTRVRLANGDRFELPNSHPVRLASGAWRAPARLENGDRIRYGSRLIRVADIEPLQRKQAVRLYVFELPGARDDIEYSTGRLTEDPRDLQPGPAEDGFCTGTPCRARLATRYQRPNVFSGAAAWFSSFFATKDFEEALRDLSSSSRRRQRKGARWIEANGTPEQRARVKLFTHNAGWRGAGLSEAEYYRNLDALKNSTRTNGRALTALER